LPALVDDAVSGGGIPEGTMPTIGISFGPIVAADIAGCFAAYSSQLIKIFAFLQFC
jgi:hypothetical protein